MRISGFTPPAQTVNRNQTRFSGDSDSKLKALADASDAVSTVGGLIRYPKTIAERKHAEAKKHFDAVSTRPGSTYSERSQAKAVRDKRAAEAKTSKNIVGASNVVGTLASGASIVTSHFHGDSTGTIAGSVATAASKPVSIFAANAHHVATSSDYDKRGEGFKEGLKTECTIM